jgi:hypothetical protein
VRWDKGKRRDYFSLQSLPSPETGTDSVPGAEMIYPMEERNRTPFCYTQVFRRGREMLLS